MNEWVIVLIAVVILFGGTQIPRIFRGLGQGIREFKTAVKDEDVSATSEPQSTAPAPPPPSATQADETKQNEG